MVKFIATTRDKDILGSELQMLLQKYSGNNPLGISYCINPKEFCCEFKNWMESGLDSSFSIIHNAIDVCRMCYEQTGNVSNEAWIRTTNFFFQLQNLLPYAKKDNEWPSCKDLLNLSEKDIIEKFSELIKDEKLKQDIRTTLKMNTTKDIINVGHLALYYLESLISIENELSSCSDDPYRNKRRLLFKFSEELDYCMQVAFKINVEIAKDKLKEAQETRRRCEEMKNNSLAIEKNNQEATLSYHLGR